MGFDLMRLVCKLAGKRARSLCSSSPVILILGPKFSLTKIKLFLDKELICAKFLTKKL